MYQHGHNADWGGVGQAYLYDRFGNRAVTGNVLVSNLTPHPTNLGLPPYDGSNQWLSAGYVLCWRTVAFFCPPRV